MIIYLKVVIFSSKNSSGTLSSPISFFRFSLHCLLVYFLLSYSCLLWSLTFCYSASFCSLLKSQCLIFPSCFYFSTFALFSSRIFYSCSSRSCFHFKEASHSNLSFSFLSFSIFATHFYAFSSPSFVEALGIGCFSFILIDHSSNFYFFLSLAHCISSSVKPVLVDCLCFLSVNCNSSLQSDISALFFSLILC